MRNVLAIAGREIRSYFSSPVAYVLLAAFLSLSGYFFYALLSGFDRMLQIYSMMRQPEMLQRINLNEMVIQPLLQNMAVLLIFTVPAITMRMFPDEKRSGTYELLLTSPVRVVEIVLGKFLSGLFLVLLMIGLSGVFGLILVGYGNPEVPMMLSGYLGLALTAIAFLALGTLASSTTDNVQVAYLSTVGTLLVVYTIGWIGESAPGMAASVVRYSAVTEHLQEFLKGLVDTKDLYYFAALTIIPVFATIRTVESVRWEVNVARADLGWLSLIFLGFGLIGIALMGAGDWCTLPNLVLGALLLVAFLSFNLPTLWTLVRHVMAFVYTLLFVALVGVGTYLSVRHNHRWDLTEASVHTLAPQSVKVVKNLDREVSMTGFVEGGVSPGLKSLFEGYADANPDRVKTQLVDPDKEPALVDQMKITTAPSVHLRYGDESFVVTQPSEETITNGLIRVSRSAKKLVYFVEGFGQALSSDEQDPKGYSAAKFALQQENYEVKPLLLPSVEKIPDDASVVVVPGIGQPLTDTAIAALDAYLKSGGHLFVLVGPRQGDEKLAALLDRWGAKLGNDIVLDQEVRLFEGPRVGMQPLAREYGAHPITEPLKDYSVFPQTRTVDPDATGKKGLSATALVKTSGSSWAETAVDDVFTKGVASVDATDKRGPVSIAVAVTAKLKEMGLTPTAPEGQKAPEEARLVVVGTPRAADSQMLSQSRPNADLFLNSVGWLVGQEELVSIRSRSVRASRAEIGGHSAMQIFCFSVLVLPELLIGLGIIVWSRRKAA